MIYEEGEEVEEVDYEKLAEHLKLLSKLEGEMIWSKPAKKAYNKWFYAYRDEDVDDKTGTYDRLNDHLIKIAACISLSRKTNMVIEEVDIEDAIVACSSLSNDARRTAGMQGKSSTANAIKAFLIIMFSAENYTLTRKQALQKGFGEFDSSELDRIVESLSQTGFVTQPTGGKEVSYKLTPLCISWWEKNTKGKK
jgi:hypothetical protein